AQLLIGLLFATTGHELSDISVSLTLLFPDKTADHVATDYRVAFHMLKWQPKKSRLGSLYQASPTVRNSADTPAERLRVISGLEIGLLAKIFDVSRPTYHHWISGSTPHGVHREHLLEVLPLVEEAAQRFSNQKDTTNWLL